MPAKKNRVCERCGSSFLKRGEHPDTYTCLACGHEGEDE